MSALDLLGTAVGVIALYLLFALLCTAIQELLQVWLRYRTRDLHLGIRRMLGEQGAQAVYTNPLIFALFSGEYNGNKYRNLPSYIPTKLFAQALLSNLDTSDLGAPLEAKGAAATPLAGVRNTVNTLPDSAMKGALLKIVSTAGEDIGRLQGDIELWYDSNMDRVSGMYKRTTTVWLFFIGIFVAAVGNFDSIAMTRYIAANPNTQQALINIATGIAAQPLPSSGTVTAAQISACQDQPIPETCPEPYRSLSSLENSGLPIGWDAERDDASKNLPFWFWAWKIVGILITATALSLGAPFWFDILNKLMVLRATVKPTEKSPPERSND